MKSLKDLVDGLNKEESIAAVINRKVKSNIEKQHQIQTFIEPKFSKFLFAIITLKYLLIYGVLVIPLMYWILIANPYAQNFIINIGGVNVQFNVILFTLLLLLILYSYIKEAMEKSFVRYRLDE